MSVSKMNMMPAVPGQCARDFRPAFREVLLASGPLIEGAVGLSDGSLPPDTGV